MPTSDHVDMGFAICMLSLILFSMLYLIKKENNRFYDGEGNIIPNEIVELYVRNNFVHISTEDSIKMSKYFYVK